MTITAFAITAAPDLSDAGRVQIVGALSGNAPGGAYKIPLRVVYPRGASPTLPWASCEAWNSNTFETFGIKGGSVIERGFFTYGIDYLCNIMGYTYCSYEWNKWMIDESIANGISPLHGAPLAQPIPFDPTWTIAAGDDAYYIMSDVSALVRGAGGFLDAAILGAALPARPAITKTFGYGCSVQAGALMRGFAMNALNTGRAAGPFAEAASFPAGKVFDGMCCTSNGSTVRTQNNVGPLYGAYSYVAGPTPASEGPFINYSSECEVMMAKAYDARAVAAHYGYYEIAGMSHLPQDFGGNNFRTIGDQIWLRPFERATLEAIRAYVDLGTPLPTSAGLEGAPVDRATPFFAGASFTGWPYAAGTTTKTFLPVVSDDDGNLKGGVRLAYVRTPLDDGRCVGGPIANYRGMNYPSLLEKDNVAADASVVAATPSPYLFAPAGVTILWTPGMFYFVRAGLQLPYDPPTLAKRYPDKCSYVAAVESGARYALDRRWITQIDYDQYVSDANAMTYQQLLDSGKRRVTAPKGSC